MYKQRLVSGHTNEQLMEGVNTNNEKHIMPSFVSLVVEGRRRRRNSRSARTIIGGVAAVLEIENN